MALITSECVPRQVTYHANNMFGAWPSYLNEHRCGPYSCNPYGASLRSLTAATPTEHPYGALQLQPL